jgi:hypothetical protein
MAGAHVSIFHSNQTIPNKQQSLYMVRKSKCSLLNKLTEAKYELHLTLQHFSANFTLSDIITTYVTEINLITF